LRSAFLLEPGSKRLSGDGVKARRRCGRSGLFFYKTVVWPMRDSVLDGEIGIIALQKGRFGKPKQAF